MLLSYVLLLLRTFLNFLFNVANNSPVTWQSFYFSVFEGCRECLQCEFWQEPDIQLLEPWVCIHERNCIFLGKVLKLCDHPAWYNTFLAKVRESYGTWVPKSQGKSGNFAKKIWCKPWVWYHFVILVWIYMAKVSGYLCKYKNTYF